MSLSIKSVSFRCYYRSLCGRIGNAKFHLNDEEYQLEANNNVHHLHGGSNGLDKRLLITTFKIISRILRLLLQFN